MRYTLLFHYAEQAGAALTDAEREAGQAAMSAYAATLQAAEVLVGAEVLQSSEMSTTVRVVDGAVQVQDGPFADTKEQLAGTVVVDVDDLDAAIEWARQAPPAQWGAVEVRPGATHTVEGRWVPNN